jgi:L-2-hydroxyglutarate oxidase LhgO
LAKQISRSVEIFRHADEYLGEGVAQSIALKERGYFFCAFNDQQAAALQSDVKRLHEIGLAHIEYLNADEVRYRFGWVGDKVIAAKYDPTAGWLDSNALMYKFVQNAKTHKTSSK